MPAIGWNTDLYDNHHGFVARYGEDLINWLRPEEGERILDLGCGTGSLTSQISQYGARVTGIDASEDMITKAKAGYPQIDFFTQDARFFSLPGNFDAVFSNATLHWIQEQDLVLAAVYRSLRPGGRFVLEMGGQGNIKHIEDAVRQALIETGSQEQTAESWFFPSPATYSALLEKHGFTVRSLAFFDRKTPLEGEEGMQNWINMFGSFFFRNTHPVTRDAVIRRAAEQLRPVYYQNGTWYADYVRLRIIAVKN